MKRSTYLAMVGVLLFVIAAALVLSWPDTAPPREEGRINPGRGFTERLAPGKFVAENGPSTISPGGSDPQSATSTHTSGVPTPDVIKLPVSPRVQLRGESALSAAEKAAQGTLEAEAQRQHDLIAEAGERQRRQAETDRTVPLVVPLPQAWRVPDGAVALAPDQAKALESVAQRFNDAMRGAGDPASVEYLDKWLEAQARADELLLAYLGPEAFTHLRERKR